MAIQFVRIADGTVAVEDTAQCNAHGAPRFRWTVVLDSGPSWAAEDLHGPRCGPEPSEREMLGTLLGFLGAALESRDCRENTGRAGDNEDLFPAELLDWAAEHSDEVGMLACEFEEGE